MRPKGLYHMSSLRKCITCEYRYKGVRGSLHEINIHQCHGTFEDLEPHFQTIIGVKLNKLSPFLNLTRKITVNGCHE